MAENNYYIPIWNGKITVPATGNTPFGRYDGDPGFAIDCEKFAGFAARRMGYPIVDIEMQDIDFYTCYEQAIDEYAAQVNQLNIRDNLLSLQGSKVQYGTNISQQYIVPNLHNIIEIAKTYGSEVGSGGEISWYSASIDVTSGQQFYDLNYLFSQSYVTQSQGYTGSVGANFERVELFGTDPKNLEVKRIFHTTPPAVSRYFDPYLGTGGTGLGTQFLLDSFGWGNMSPAVNFMIMPIYEDLLRIQAIEFNQQIRRSQYSFDIKNNRLRLFPVPNHNMKVWIEYILKSDRADVTSNNTAYDSASFFASGSSQTYSIADISNIPYSRMYYHMINEPGKQWIRDYALALCKETLGMIRGKYQQIPFMNREVQMDGDTLRSEASSMKDQLVDKLKEMLEQTSRTALMEAKKNDHLNQIEMLKNIPLPPYVGE